MDSTFESTSENKSRLQNLRCLVTCKVKHAERCSKPRSAQLAGAAALLQPHPTAHSIVIFFVLRSLSLHRVHFVHPTCLQT